MVSSSSSVSVHAIQPRTATGKIHQAPPFTGISGRRAGRFLHEKGTPSDPASKGDPTAEGDPAGEGGGEDSPAAPPPDSPAATGDTPPNEGDAVGAGEPTKDEDPVEDEEPSPEDEESPPPPEATLPSDDKNRTGAADDGPPSHSHSGDSFDEPDEGTSGNATAAEADCAALERSGVQGQVQYEVEVAAATEEDAKVLGQDVNDLVVSHLSTSLPQADCQRRRLFVGRNTQSTANQFLSFKAADTTVNAEDSCTELTTGDSCYTVTSTVTFLAVPGDGEETADAQVIQSIPSAFSNLSPKSVQFVQAQSSDGPPKTSAAAARSGESNASQPKGSASTTAAIVLGVLVVAAVVGLLYVRRERRRRRDFKTEIEKIENTVDLSESADSTPDDPAFVYSDETDADTACNITSQERFFSRLRLSRRDRNGVPPPPPLPAVAEAVVHDSAIEVLHREPSTFQNRRYSCTLLTPQQPAASRSRQLVVPNTVDL